MARVRMRMDEAGWQQLQAHIREKVTAPITDEVARRARSLAAVDTGEMIGTIRTIVPAWNRGQVWVGSDHWSYNEYGTERMDAQPFMRPALYGLAGTTWKV
jgi:HK97 gp10 family phage protein